MAQGSALPVEGVEHYPRALARDAVPPGQFFKLACSSMANIGARWGAMNLAIKTKA
jgi:hypothetical protein